jgi:hypothetical protein
MCAQVKPGNRHHQKKRREIAQLAEISARNMRKMRSNWI